MTTGDLQNKARLRPRARKIRTDLKEITPCLVHLVPKAEVNEKTEEQNNEKELVPEQQSIDSSLPDLGERYKVLSVIGQGGMGTVYKVFDNQIEKTLAIKVLQSDLAEDQTALRRFEQEAEAAAQLEHNNLVAVFGYGKTSSGSPYLVMDYLDGASLSTLLKQEGMLDSTRALNLFEQICDALVHAHEKGVIHRDVKPANVIVTNNESGIETARVVDFGIAKILPVSNRETHNLTETRQVFGSPHYMSPEHCLGFKMDERSDIYSLGCLMYEVLTGNPPYPESDAIQVVIKHINEEAKPFSRDLNNDPVARKLESVVLKCLEKEQADRYQSVNEVLKDIELIQAGKAPSRFVRRRAAKLEYTASQIWRSIFATFLLLLFISCSVGWLTLDGNQIFGGAMLLVCLSGFYVFSSTAIEKYRRIIAGKTSASDWWSMSLVVSLIAMCLTYLPSAFEVAVSSLDLPIFSNRPDWLVDLFSGLDLIHLVAIASTVVSLSGEVFFGGAKKTRVWRIVVQFVCLTYVMALISMSAFPIQVSMFTKYLSDNELLNQRFPVSSEGLLNFSLKLYPLNQQALFSLVDKKLDAHQPESANQLFNDYFALETAPKKLAAAHFKRFETLTEKESWRRLSELSKAIKYFPRYDYYEHRGQLHLSRGEFNDALKDYEEAIRSNPSSATSYIGRARIFSATRNFQIALTEINEIAEQKGGWNNIEVFFLRALLFEKLNLHNMAMHNFMTVTELAKSSRSLSDEDAYKAAYCFRMLGDTDNSMKYLESVDEDVARKIDQEYRWLNLDLKWYEKVQE